MNSYEKDSDCCQLVALEWIIMPKMTRQIPVRTLFAISQNTEVAMCNYAKYQMVPFNFRQVSKPRNK